MIKKKKKNKKNKFLYKETKIRKMAESTLNCPRCKKPTMILSVINKYTKKEVLQYNCFICLSVVLKERFSTIYYK